jgi:hypothetical protein
MEVCIANEKAAFALSNGVAGENVGNGNKDTVDSKSSNKRFESIHRAGLYLPESTTKELMSLIKPICSMALRVNAFLVSTRVTVSSPSATGIDH